MRRIFKITLLSFLFVLLIFSGGGKTGIKSSLNISKTTEQIIIDGKLNEGVWKQRGFSEFLQRDPNEGKPATEKTEVWVTYDDHAIYVAAHCYDSRPDSIIANLARRDYSTTADQFFVYLDTFNDKQTGFYFAVTPAGQLKDGILESDTWTNSSWDGVWEGRSEITEDGWTLEMRIPYSQLRFSEKERYTWGVNFRRDIARKNELDYMVYTPKNESGFVSRFPEMTGIENINPPQRFSVLPYVTGKADYLKHREGDPFNKGKNFSSNLGVDIKYGLGSNLTLDATINPDFGQVEVDPAVVNLSDTETFFSENRPFFIEGMSIFRFGNGGANKSSWDSSPTLFYSRRIGRAPQGSIPRNDFSEVVTGTNILGAGKLSGRILGDWKFATVQALTSREYAGYQYNNIKSEAEVEPLTYYGVARAQKDYDAGRQGLGFLATATNRFFKDDNLRNNINSSAFVAGVDGWTFLDEEKDFVVTGWLGATTVNGNKERMIRLQRSSLHYFQQPDANFTLDSSATSLSGYGGRIFLNKQSNAGGWWGNASVTVLSPGFNSNDLGYQTRSNMIRWHVQYVKVWNTPNEIYRSISLGDGFSQSFDYNGVRTGTSNGLWGSITFANYWGADFWFNYSPETKNNRRTRGGPYTLNPVSRSLDFSFYSNQNKPVTISMHYNGNNGTGSYTHIGGSVAIKPSTSLSLSIGTCYTNMTENAQWIGSYADATAKSTYGRRYVFGTMNQKEISPNMRLDWLITPTLSFQVYFRTLISSGKYNDLKVLDRAGSFDFIKYGDKNSRINKLVSNSGNISYEMDADGDGPSPVYKTGNPDYNFTSLIGNAVLRWEYMPGSTVFFVWTQNRADSELYGNFDLGNSFDEIFRSKPDNIFMIKINYWFGK